MSDQPSSTGSPTSSSIDPNLLSPPISATVLPSAFYSKSTHTRSQPITSPPNASNPASTPISNKTSGNHSYASETHDRDSANYRLAQETSGLFLGSMPPQKFLKRFLPISQNTPECPDSKGAFAGVSSANKEVDMYPPFVSTVLCFCAPVVQQHLIDNCSDCIRS